MSSSVRFREWFEFLQEKPSVISMSADKVLARLRSFTMQDVTMREMRALANMFWAHGAHTSNPQFIHRAWMTDAFSRCTEDTLERRLLAVMTCWNQLPSRLEMRLPASYIDRVHLGLGMSAISHARAALTLSDDPAWWTLCLENGQVLSSKVYEVLIRELCKKLVPEHRYMSLAESLDVSLAHVLYTPTAAKEMPVMDAPSGLDFTPEVA